jgi:uncharacterized protein (TIGR02453 family)
MAQILTCPVPTKSFRGFCPLGIDLLRTLKRKRSSQWLEAQKEMYEAKITGPLLEMVCTISREFARFAPNYVTAPEKAVFSVFGATGAPRRTPPAAIWVHRDAKGLRGACFYFHFTEKEAVVLGGVYTAETADRLAIRKLLQQHYTEFATILADATLKSFAGVLRGEKLKRMPYGFSSSHPAADFVRRRQWYVATMLDMDLISTERLLPTVVEHFEAMAPLVEFLNRPISQSGKKKKTVLREFPRS